MIRSMFVLAAGLAALPAGADRVPSEPVRTEMSCELAAVPLDWHDARRVVAPNSRSTVVIRGRVVDAVTKVPLAGAQVFVEGTAVGSLVNSVGAFMLFGHDAWIGRTVTVNAMLIGYGATSRQITVSGGTNLVDFELHEQALTLDGIIVTGTAGQARRREIGSTVESLGARDIEVQASDAPPASGSEIRIRGNASLTQAEAQQGAGQVTVTRGPDGTIESVTVVKGAAASTLYGNAPATAYGTRESYAYIEESGFLDVGDRPLSTFSIDVDRASYANVRRFVNSGQRPPVDAVRIEELVNYFTYDDPAPDMDDERAFLVNTEVAPAPWEEKHLLVRVGVKGRSVDLETAPPSNLVFLLDVSGSMSSHNKLPLLKRSLAMLVDELRPEDRVSIVVYAGAAGLVLPSTPGSDRCAILGALGRLQAGGSTAGGAGIQLAYSVAVENFIEGGNNRVILATDGDFNVGASSDADMIRLIEEKRESDVFLTVLGFGTGNLQDAKMEQIADHGNGNFAYIDSDMEARKTLVNEMGGTLVTIAQDVKIQVEFNPATVESYRLIGYENRALADEDFNDDTKDAGELGAGHSVTALYEVVPVGVMSPALAPEVDDLRYQRDRSDSDIVESNELLFVKLRYQEPGGSESKLVSRPVDRVEWETSDDFRFAAAVAAWGMLLRDSEHVGDFTLDDVARLARESLGEDEFGYRAGFLTLIDTARARNLLAAQPGARGR